MWALGSLRAVPPHLPAASPLQDCAITMWALGSLRAVLPARWIQTLAEESFARFPDFTTQVGGLQPW